MSTAVLLDKIQDQYIVKVDHFWYDYILGYNQEYQHNKKSIAPDKAQLLQNIINDTTQYSESFTNSNDLLQDLYKE